MNRTTLLIVSILVFSLFGVKAEDFSIPYNEIKFPVVEAQLFHSQSLGLGVSYYSGSRFNAYHFVLSNDFNLRYKQGNYIYSNKLTVSRILMLLETGITLNNYTDFKGYGLSVAPFIGINYTVDRFLYYSYNVNCINNSINKFNTNSITLRIQFGLINYSKFK